MSAGVAVFRARRVLQTYAGPRTQKEAVVDLVADVMHYCQHFGISMAECYVTASLYVDQEQDRAPAPAE